MFGFRDITDGMVTVMNGYGGGGNFHRDLMPTGFVIDGNTAEMVGFKFGDIGAEPAVPPC